MANNPSISGHVNGEQLDERIREVSGTDASRLEEMESAIEELGQRLQEADTGGGAVDKETIREVLREEFADEIEAAAGRVMIPARKIGPAPAGQYHEVDRWGIHFSTGRAAHLGSAVVDAAESGTFTAALYGFDDEDITGEVAVREIEVDAGVNTIDLDMDVPEAGSYLLTRVGTFPLRRREWSGWNSQSREGITLHGGNKPDGVDPDYAPYDENQYWYYFFDLQIAADEDAH